MNEKPTHLDLFSGIGGFSLAFEAEGFRTIGFSEIDPWASAVLKKHWPHVPNYGDVRNVPALRCDVLTGGFPCQPFSFAGKRKGKNDNRHLWPAMRDVIDRCQPTWIVGENVLGIIGMELERVLADLEGLGFIAQTFVVPACAVDAKHRRDRVWIIAYNDRQRGDASRTHEIEAGAATEAFGSDGTSMANNVRKQALRNYPKGFQPVSPGNGENVSDTNDQGLEGRDRRVMQKRARPADYSRWLPEPGLGRVADGIPNRTHRLRCLGNSIVPQVAQVFAKAIRQLI
jgi:DNA (cytosine-5)-methyltransferase 1